MAQINLLSPNTSKPNLGQAALRIGVKVLVGLLILMVVYYVWTLVDGKRTASSIVNLQNKITSAEGQVLGQKDRQELIVRQGQIQALSNLLKNHVYWSQLIPELAESTLKTASYVSFSANDQGTGTMVVSVPSYTDLDKFLQVFDLPQFNEALGQAIGLGQKAPALVGS